MEEKELEKQNTFFKYTENIWYDRQFEFEIRFNKGMAVLSHHCEVEGNSWFIKYLKSLEDLKRVYEAITDETLTISNYNNDSESWEDVFVKIRQTITDKGMPQDYVDWSICITLLSQLYEPPKLK